MIEDWKDIPGYEGIYQASTLGRIRTAPGKTTSNQRYGVRCWKSRIMKGRGKSKAGYKVGLWKNGTCKSRLVARLVALTWVPGHRDGITVNHINGDRFDNRVENLEWLPLADNIRHGFRTGLYPTKSVALVDGLGIEHRFVSLASADRFLGFRAGYLSYRLSRGARTACGYTIKVL